MGCYVSPTPLIGEMPAHAKFILIGHQRGDFHVQKAFAQRIDKAELIKKNTLKGDMTLVFFYTTIAKTVSTCT